MSINPSFSGEVQFRRYSDTSTQGQQVVFAVQDREALESFIGKEGKRFMAVLVEIGDDEQPVEPNPLITKQSANSRSAKTALRGDLCFRAVMWCKDPEFWHFLNNTVVPPRGVSVESENEASEMIKGMCSIESRRQLDESPAKEIFIRQFVGPWHKWNIARGRAQ